ncbi:MAG: LCP family protein [Actinomycetota bacterium]|nr:LCP family protein [Actinomycetota bacterium]
MTNATERLARPGLAAVFSGVIPGAGQWYGGRLRRAILVFAPVVLLAALAFAAFSLGPVRLLELAVQPTVLWALLILDLAVLAWRGFAVVDAFVVTRRGRSTGAWATAVLVVTLVVVAVPHAAFMVYDLEAIDLLESVFVGDEVAAPIFIDEVQPRPAPFAPGDTDLVVVPDPALIVEPRVPTPRSTRNLIFRDSVGDPEAIVVWPAIIDDPVEAMELLPPVDTAGLDRITILLAGGDAGPGRGGLRTDSIMVATLDTVTGRAALFGIPRNLVQVPLRADYDQAFTDLEQRITPWDERKDWTDDDGDGTPDQFVPCHCFPDQINAIYPFTRKWTETYPNEVDPGMATLRDSVEIMLGIDIDFYALVNMSGFVRVVDALGGVRTYVTGPVQAEVSPAREGEDWIEVDIRTGWNRLSGHEALAYVRERKTVSDYIRMRRQRCMLKSVAASADVTTIVSRFPALSRAVKSSVRTDIPLDFVPTLVSAAATLDFDDIVTVGFTPPDYAPTGNHRNQPIPDLAAIRAKVQEILGDDPSTAIATGRDTECRV